MAERGAPSVARIRLLWHAQAQFAGYLLAEHEQLGAPRGIAIANSPIDFTTGPIDALLAGDVDFAVASPSHLLESARADELVLLLVIQQESALVYPAHRARGIAALADLAGRRVGVWPGREDLEFRWMLVRAGMGADSVVYVPMADTVGPFLAGDVECAQMTVYHELQRVTDAMGGASAVTLFRASDHGAGLIKDGLVTTRRLVETHPGFVQAVVDTVLAGWAAAFADPERAVAACLHANPALDREHQLAQLDAIHRLAATGATRTHGLGYPDPLHIARAAQAMADLGHPLPPTLVDAASDTAFWQRAGRVQAAHS